MITDMLKVRTVAATAAVFSALMLAACSSDKKSTATPAASSAAKPAAATATAAEADGGSALIAVTPGEAGGVMEETINATATIRAIEPASRKVTLQSENGNTGTFTAPPEVRNFDQLRVGDRVNATMRSRLTVFVSKKGASDEAYAALIARAPKGASPGAMVAESYEIVGTIKSIDTTTRDATIAFPEGETRTIPVRDDVDLSRYKAGDKVVIRITQQLTVLVDRP